MVKEWLLILVFALNGQTHVVTEDMPTEHTCRQLAHEITEMLNPSSVKYICLEIDEMRDTLRK